MKTKYYFSVGIVILLIVIGTALGMRKNRDNVQEQEVRQQETQKQGQEQQMQKQQEEVQETEEADDAVLLRTMVTLNEVNEKMEGWFADLLKEKLDIEIFYVDYFQTAFKEEYEEEFNKGIDLYRFYGSTDYYDQVKEGKLKNLEPYIKKHPKIYSKYSNAIKHVKKDTYKHTKTKGIYGLPTYLQSFKDTGKGHECNYVSVPTSAKHPDEAMKLLTWSASDEGIMNIAYGPEGQMWKKEKGKYILIKDWYKINDKNPGKKFIETKRGKEDFYSAVCQMELVGNQALADELIK